MAERIAENANRDYLRSVVQSDEEVDMPIISMFYGIIVMMYYFDDRRHHQPHVHVEYGDEEAVVSIPDGIVMEGSIRSAKLRLVQAWIEYIRTT